MRKVIRVPTWLIRYLLLGRTLGAFAIKINIIFVKIFTYMRRIVFSRPSCFNCVIKMKFSINFEFWYQIKAMTVRNILIKRREMKKTLSVSILNDIILLKSIINIYLYRLGNRYSSLYIRTPSCNKTIDTQPLFSIGNSASRIS